VRSAERLAENVGSQVPRLGKCGEHPVEFGKSEGWVDFELKLVGMSEYSKKNNL